MSQTGTLEQAVNDANDAAVAYLRSVGEQVRTEKVVLWRDVSLQRLIHETHVAPWDIRLIIWSGRRLVKFYHWWKKKREFVPTVTSGLVPLSAVTVRSEICGKCDQVDSRRGWLISRPRLYCKACRCPRWFLSRLSVKWRLKRPSCARGLWPGQDGKACVGCG